MALKDRKITEAAIAANGVQSAPDRLTGTAAENKAFFDKLVRNVVAECVNGLIEELTGTAGAEQIGMTPVESLPAENVQQAMKELKEQLDNAIIGAGGVASFNGRVGKIEPEAGDYTAEMVGARPDTWMPSAEDVGARPDTWTPEAAAMDLLWENASPGSSFAPQTVSVDCSDYDMFIITTISGGFIVCNRGTRSIMSKYVGMFASSSTMYPQFYTRYITITDTGVTFEEGRMEKSHQTNSSYVTTQNGFLIPRKIYGIKEAAAA